MEGLSLKEYNSLLSLNRDIKNNAIAFHRMLENIKPKIYTCVYKLIDCINTGITIEKTSQIEDKFYINYRNFCVETSNTITKIHEIIIHLMTIIQDTKAAFIKLRNSYTRSLILAFNDSTWYAKWFRDPICNSLDLFFICDVIENYKEELINFLLIPKEIFDSKNNNTIQTNIFYKTEIVYELKYYLNRLSELSIVCEEYAIISAVKYKDMINKTNNNHNSYKQINTELEKIRTNLTTDLLIKSYEKKIDELNAILNYYWIEYIDLITEQHNLQLITNNLKLDTNNKVLIYEIILQLYIDKNIENVLFKMNEPLKSLAMCTRGYNKDCKQYIKVIKNYNNFIRIMFS